MKGKGSLNKKTFFFVAVAVIFATGAQGVGLDDPHKSATNGEACDPCHQMTSTYPKLLPPLDFSPQNIDESIPNAVCTSCHNDVDALSVKTHSSTLTDKGYGEWSVECWVCHNQHVQEQNRFNGSTYGMYIRRAINLAKIKWYDTITENPLPPKNSETKSVIFKGPTGSNSFADGEGQTDGICEVCHTQTSHWNSNGLNANKEFHENTGETNCTLVCHKHTDGFIHGGGGTGCISCHGHDPGYIYEAGKISEGKGSFQSHSTHTEHDDELIGPPVLPCAHCHDTTKFPAFLYKAELDTDGNGRINLAETDVCNPCHSEGGPYDGLNDPAVGAKKNWKTGIYSGEQLAPGKEKWCVTCHDSGTSTIGSGTRPSAPDVARNNTFSGYYISGHGAMQDGDLARIVECGDCHDLTMSHIDSAKTYKASSDNYQVGYRLAGINFSLWGPRPLNIPKPAVTGQGCDFTIGDAQLCLKCHAHSADKLFSNSKSFGTWNCANPFPGPVQTGFRNETTDGYSMHGAIDLPANIHWDHVADIHNLGMGNMWDSDRDGAPDSRATCITCHNPHGATQSDGSTATKRMTRLNLKIEWGHNAWGDYGAIGTTALLSAICANTCHATDPLDNKYYRSTPAPILTGIDAYDIDPAPALANHGFTNDRTVRVTFTVSGATPTEMILAEDAAFTKNVQGWIPYAATFDYTLSDGEESKTLYARVKNGVSNLSDVNSFTITLDTTSPNANTSLTIPYGGETWQQVSLEDITWNPSIPDADTKLQISLLYSTDSGNSFPNSISPVENNDGVYSWTVPALNSTQVRVRLIATDRAGNQGVDDSGDFTVQP